MPAGSIVTRVWFRFGGPMAHFAVKEFHRRFQIVVLLLLDTSAASFAATVIYAQNVNGLISTDSASSAGSPAPNRCSVEMSMASARIASPRFLGPHYSYRNPTFPTFTSEVVDYVTPIIAG